MKQFEILLRKFLLSVLIFFKKAEKVEKKLESYDCLKILFIRLNRIGDALVTTPLLYTIKKNLDCHVTILASRYNYFIFNNNQLADEVIVYNKKVSSFIKLINQKNFDVIVDLHDDISTTVSYLVAFSKVKNKIGLKKGIDKLYTHLVDKLDPSKYHVIDRVMEFTKVFGIKYDGQKINVIYNPKTESKKIVDNYIVKHFPVKNFLVGINISSGSSARFWGVKKFKEVISLLSNYGVNIILLCIERDIKYAWEIAGKNIPIFYRNDFDEFAAMIERIDLLFTPDTSIVHIASAFNVPVFGLYVKYNTNHVVWYPYKSDYEVIITTEPTLENINTEIVKEKFIPFFEKYFYEYKSKTT